MTAEDLARQLGCDPGIVRDLLELRDASGVPEIVNLLTEQVGMRFPVTHASSHPRTDDCDGAGCEPVFRLRAEHRGEQRP